MWKNAAERTIRDLKCGAVTKITNSRRPNKLWYHCLKLVGLICSHNALDIFKFEGGVTETAMTGNTANISIIADHEWYDWIKFYDPVGKNFPEEKMYLGRYLGTAIGVGPDLTANILKSNGEVVHSSTYCYILPEEVNDEK